MFKNYTSFLYKNPVNGSSILIKDLFNSIQFVFKQYKRHINMFEMFVIQDGDTPEDVSYRFYHKYDYYFLILMINDRFDPFYDWPLTNDELLNFATKYVTEDYFEIQSQDPSYNPKDPEDEFDPDVQDMIGKVFSKMNVENENKRILYLPSIELMERMYDEFLSVTSEFE